MMEFHFSSCFLDVLFECSVFLFVVPHGRLASVAIWPVILGRDSVCERLRGQMHSKD